MNHNYTVISFGADKEFDHLICPVKSARIMLKAILKVKCEKEPSASL